MPPSDAPALRLEAIKKNLGHRPVLRGVTLRADAGEMVAVLGTNGAGKSTLLRVLATIYRATSGDGYVHGQSLETARDAARGLTGYLGHTPGLYDGLTCTENLHLVARLYGVRDPAPRVSRALRESQLDDYAHTMVRHLSKGLTRRLALERVLLHSPRLLLLDEPFDGLDPASQERLVARLREFRAEGNTVLLVTHDLPLAASLCDRAIVLRGGVVAVDRPTSEGLPPDLLVGQVAGRGLS
jgi:heme exporter protein A